MNVVQSTFEGDPSTRAGRLPTFSKSIASTFARWPTGMSSADISPLAPRDVPQGEAVRSHIISDPVEISDS